MSRIVRPGVSFFLITSLLLLAPPALKPEPFTHQASAGETLYGIARQYGVAVSALQSMNNIADPSQLRVGQTLKIPSSYTVKAGDTYYGIARSHNLSLQELLDLNGRRQDQLLRTGEILIISSDSPASSPSQSGDQAGRTEQSGQTSSTTTVTLSTETTLTVTPPRTGGTLLSSQIATDSSGTTWPLDGERYEFSGKFPGIAIVAERGTPVRAVSSGRVIYSGPHSSLGQVVFVQHPRGYVYIYGGNDTLTVQTGDEVSIGTELGTLGVTPAVQRAQLFFSVWKDGAYLDPRQAPR